jgi:hypothetical protein
LYISSELSSDTLLKKDYIIAFQDTFPNLYAINDIELDQGGWVNVWFTASRFDSDPLIISKAATAELYTVEINEGSNWTAAATTVAYGKTYYSVLVPTTHDSTADSEGLLNFRVIAGMEEGNFASNVMSGNSVDNLAPATPSNIKAIFTSDSKIKLEWSPNEDEDLQYYGIFRSIDGRNFKIIKETTDTVYLDHNFEYDNDYYYAVKAFDYSGNSSGLSDVVKITITAIDITLNKPVTYYLGQNFPNPFNLTTTIEYGLLYPGNVRIIVYDILGNIVRELENSKKHPGNYSIKWNGKNEYDEPVSTGIYYYQIITGEFKSIKKMLIIK